MKVALPFLCAQGDSNLKTTPSFFSRKRSACRLIREKPLMLESVYFERIMDDPSRFNSLRTNIVSSFDISQATRPGLFSDSQNETEF